MAKGLTNTQYYKYIADALRTKTGSSEKYTPAQMSGAIAALPGGQLTGFVLSAGAVASSQSANGQGGSGLELYTLTFTTEAVASPQSANGQGGSGLELYTLTFTTEAFAVGTGTQE